MCRKLPKEATKEIFLDDDDDQSYPVSSYDIWAPPETSCLDVDFTFQSDTFSLGCFYYFVLSSGGHPFVQPRTRGVMGDNWSFFFKGDLLSEEKNDHPDEVKKKRRIACVKQQMRAFILSPSFRFYANDKEWSSFGLSESKSFIRSGCSLELCNSLELIIRKMVKFSLSERLTVSQTLDELNLLLEKKLHSPRRPRDDSDEPIDHLYPTKVSTWFK